MRDVAIAFRPTGSTPGSGALGVTDAEGRFEMKDVRGGEGVRPGQYVIHLYPAPQATGKVMADVAVSTSTNKIPSVYINPSSSPIQATVPVEGGGMEIHLTPDGQNIKVENQPLSEYDSPS